MRFKGLSAVILSASLVISAGCTSLKSGNTNRDPVTRTGPTARPGTTGRVSPPTIKDVKEISAYRLKSDDQIIIYLRSIPQEQRIEDVIDENGNITLDYIGAVHATGQTASELEDEIQRAYVNQKIYKHITVNVVVPSHSYYVRGEVNQPGRFPLTSGITILRAIAAAGGYTEFANPKKTRIIRGENILLRNLKDLEQKPEKDEPLEAGDVIVVPRGFI